MDTLLLILQGLFVLIVIVVIFFLAWYVPHLIARKGTSGTRGGKVTVLEKIPVSKDSYIMLLKTFDEVIVVGVTPGGMTTLKELDGVDVDAESYAQSPQNFPQAFKTALNTVLPEESMVRKTIDRFTHGRKGGDGDGQ